MVDMKATHEERMRCPCVVFRMRCLSSKHRDILLLMSTQHIGNNAAKQRMRCFDALLSGNNMYV